MTLELTDRDIVNTYKLMRGCPWLNLNQENVSGFTDCLRRILQADAIIDRGRDEFRRANRIEVVWFSDPPNFVMRYYHKHQAESFCG
jgi:hypothetical protein